MSSEISGAALSKLTITGTALLIALVLYFGVTSGMTNPVVLLIMIIPISLTLPGQIRGSSRVFQWLCFVVLFLPDAGNFVVSFRDLHSPGARDLVGLSAPLYFRYYFYPV